MINHPKKEDVICITNETLSKSVNEIDLNTFHKSIKHHICPLCLKNFNSKSHLKQHLNKKYKCIQNNPVIIKTSETTETSETIENLEQIDTSETIEVSETIENSENIKTYDNSSLDTYFNILNDVKKKQQNHNCNLNQVIKLTKENKFLKDQLHNILDILKNTLLVVK